MSDQEQQKKPNPQLDAARYSLAEQVRNVHSIVVPAGITREQVLHPDFWGGIAAKLRQYDRIEVTCDNDTYYAELLVVGAERTHAFVRVLQWRDLTEQEKGAAAPATITAPRDGYEIVHRGQHLKWCVIRKADNVAIREKEPSKQAAQTWLDDYLRVTAAS